jgi:hypothetical protein
VKKKKRKVVKAAAPKPVEPAPAPAPEPAPAIVEAPITPTAEPGFFEQYWTWLLGLVIAAIAIVFMMRKKD